MGIPHLITDAINRPILATPLKLQMVLNVLGNKSGLPVDIDLSRLGAMSSAHGGEAKSYARTPNQTDEQQIAVVPIIGSLVARTHGTDADSGLRSYRTIQRDLQACRRDPSIGGIILDMDSYGGTSAGCERLARFVGEIAGEVPVYGLVDLNAYSACYQIAAACSRVILTDRTAGVGSIGCIAVHLDVSKWADKEGLNYTVVTFGKHKDDFSPYDPLTREEIAALQKSVDAHGHRFAETVAEFRGVSLQKILDTEARCYYGRDAVTAGLADEIMSFEDAVAMLTDEINTKSRTSATMSQAMDGAESEDTDMDTRERMEKLLAADDGPEAIAALGYVKKEDAEKQTVEAVETAVDATVNRTGEVLDIAELANVSASTVISMIREGIDAKQAREVVQQLRADESSKKTVKSVASPLSGSERHPLLANLESKYKQEQ